MYDLSRIFSSISENYYYWYFWYCDVYILKDTNGTVTAVDSITPSNCRYVCLSRAYVEMGWTELESCFLG